MTSDDYSFIELDEEPDAHVQDAPIPQSCLLRDCYLPVFSVEPVILDNTSNFISPIEFVQGIPISKSVLKVDFYVPVNNSLNFAKPNDEEPNVELVQVQGDPISQPILNVNYYVPVIREELNTLRANHSNEINRNQGY